MSGFERCLPGHGQNRNAPGASKKAGGNKGIARDRQLQKRAEAEARNARTRPERRRAYRLNAERLAA